MWVVENTRNHSTRAAKFLGEVEHLNRELNYLQMRALLIPCFFWVGFYIFIRFYGPSYWRGHMSQYDRPILLQGSGGSTIK